MFFISLLPVYGELRAEQVYLQSCYAQKCFFEFDCDQMEGASNKMDDYIRKLSSNFFFPRNSNSQGYATAFYFYMLHFLII